MVDSQAELENKETDGDDDHVVLDEYNSDDEKYWDDGDSADEDDADDDTHVTKVTKQCCVHKGSGRGQEGSLSHFAKKLMLVVPDLLLQQNAFATVTVGSRSPEKPFW